LSGPFFLADLEAGNIPDLSPVRRWFELALVKKMGVLRQPPACWTSDPKINPPWTHLLTAALLLDDAEAVAAARSVVRAEIDARRPGRGGMTESLALEAEQELIAHLSRFPQEVRRVLSERAAAYALAGR